MQSQPQVERVETVVIGAGQAGLATSFCLKQRERPHVVLERGNQVAGAWRNERWDSFALNTPNWTIRLPGATYAGNDPDGFMPRAEVVAMFEEYARANDLPVRFQARVESVERQADGRFHVVSQHGTVDATSVVVATGLFQKPKVHAAAATIPAQILQLQSTAYRNAAALPPGAVLVVGSAQSGCQIAEDLLFAGRQVYLAVGRCGRFPRHYRGRDIFAWLTESGFFDQTADTLPSPRARFAGNPQVAARTQGPEINLHRFARDGVVLLGHLKEVDGATLHFAPDLYESLAFADKLEADLVTMVDNYVSRNGIEAPEESRPVLQDGFDAPLLTELDLEQAGVSTVIWASGFDFDFSWVHLPVFDDVGFPVQQRGVTAVSGLYFVGMPWTSDRKSGLLLGVGATASHVAADIAARATV